MAIFVLLAAPASALAADDSLIPPGNSAVNQYTESFPTSNGNKEIQSDEKKRRGNTLDSQTARRLQQQGEDGQTVVEIVAATGTAPVNQPSSSTEREDSAGADDAAIGSAAVGGDEGSEPGGTSGARSSEIAGDSPIAEVLAQATGATSGDEAGLWLPFAILAILAASVAFALKRRRMAS